MFVELVKTNDDQVFINPALVTHVSVRRSNPDEESMVYLAAGSGESQAYVIVKGEAAEVVREIENASVTTIRRMKK